MFLLLAILASFVHGCIRTSETSTTSTSAITTTTTSAATTSISSTTSTATTTTTTAGNCGNCDPTIVALQPDPDPVNGHPPTSALGPTDAATGCAVLLVTCTPLAGNGVSLLTFFSTTGMDLGQAAVGDPGVGMLLCNSAGEWTYTAPDISGNLVTTVVGSAQCLG